MVAIINIGGLLGSLLAGSEYIMSYTVEQETLHGKVFKLVNWRFCRKLPNFKTRKYIPTLLHYAEVLTITKFKLRQCIMKTDSPNLMLTKVSRYTVCSVSQIMLHDY